MAVALGSTDDLVDRFVEAMTGLAGDRDRIARLANVARDHLGPMLRGKKRPAKRSRFIGGRFPKADLRPRSTLDGEGLGPLQSKKLLLTANISFVIALLPKKKSVRKRRDNTEDPIGSGGTMGSILRSQGAHAVLIIQGGGVTHVRPIPTEFQGDHHSVCGNLRKLHGVRGRFADLWGGPARTSHLCQ
jgi:hypothetical protein